MPAALREKLTYANLIATLALFLALSGGAWALSKDSVKSSNIVNGTVNSKDLQDGGAKYKDLKDVVRVKKKLNYGQTKTLLEHGSLTLTATCIQNGTDNGGAPNQDIARILISTDEDGAVFEGEDTKDGNDATDFLDTDTPEADRVFNEQIAPTGAGGFGTDDADGGAWDRRGKGILLAGDEHAMSVNLFGSDCRFWGVAHLVK